jgi:single-stranded-DNA-specific exonuclease
MDRAVSRVLTARESGERATVYGDYDADGITGSSLLVLGLRAAGIQAGTYIPHRDREGYGLNRTALESLKSQGSSLIITVDSGTTSIDEIDHAAVIGLDVVVLDHHTIPPKLPRAPVVNPHRPESAYPFRHFCGAGVGFKFLQALYLALGRGQDEVEQYQDLAAIGTVADLTPLEGENRRIVRAGLQAMAAGSRPGLQALIDRAGLDARTLDARDLAFMVAPRLNAMGRLEHALVSYRLLMATDRAEAADLAAELETTNRARQELTVQLVAQARDSLPADDVPLVMVSGPDYPVGMVGLVAGRLAEDRYRPAIAMEEGPEFSRGSARSIPGVSIIGILSECRDLMVRYGGHPQAAGFTIETRKLPALRQRLMAAAEAALEGQELQPVLTIEANTRMKSLPGAVMNLLGKLAPFGAGNPEPLFMTRRVEVLGARTVGADGAHLSLTLSEERATWRAMGFGMGARLPDAMGPIDVVYSIGLDRLDGNGLLQLNVKDFRSSLPE